MNKKGLSEVVTTVLIILLVLAAIVTIWTYVQPTIKNAAKKIGGSDCLTLDVSAQNCKLVKDANNVTTGANVTIKRGTDTSNIATIIYLFDTPSGRTPIEDSTNLVEVLGVKTVPVSVTGNITKVSVSVKIKSDAGDITTCDPISTPVTCA